MAPPMSYIPVIGNDNLVSVRESDDTPVSPGTINGAAVLGRLGTMKTSLLVAMQNSISSTTPETLLRVEIACPPGFVTPAANSLVGFDYTKLFPVATVQILGVNFEAGDPTDLAWPPSLSDFFELSEANTLVQLTIRPIEANPPSATYPYGTLTYEVSGATQGGSAGAALIAVTIDFGASSSN